MVRPRGRPGRCLRLSLCNNLALALCPLGIPIAPRWPIATTHTPLCGTAGEALLRQKLGCLNFSAAAGWDPTEMLPVYLAAACDPNEQVCLSVGRKFQA